MVYLNCIKTSSTKIVKYQHLQSLSFRVRIRVRFKISIRFSVKYRVMVGVVFKVRMWFYQYSGG